MAVALPLLVVLALIGYAALTDAPVVLQTEATPDSPSYDLAKATACQDDSVPAGAAFSQIVLAITTRATTPAPVRVTVSDPASGREIARGAADRAAQHPLPTVVPLDHLVRDGRQVRVCASARGARGPVFLLGSVNPRFADPFATYGGQQSPGRAYIAYQREGRSRLTALVAGVPRSALFRAAWLRPWLVWVLVALVVLVGPVLLGVALLASVRADTEARDAHGEADLLP